MATLKPHSSEGDLPMTLEEGASVDIGNERLSTKEEFQQGIEEDMPDAVVAGDPTVLMEDAPPDDMEECFPTGFLTCPPEVRQPILRLALEDALDEDKKDEQSARKKVTIPERFNLMLKNLASTLSVTIVTDLLHVVSKMKREIIHLEPNFRSAFELLDKDPVNYTMAEWKCVADGAHDITVAALKELDSVVSVKIANVHGVVRAHTIAQAVVLNNGYPWNAIPFGPGANPIQLVNTVQHINPNPTQGTLPLLVVRQELNVAHETFFEHIERRTPIVNAIEYFTKGNTPRKRLRKVLRFSILRVQQYKETNDRRLRRFQKSKYPKHPRFPKNTGPVPTVGKQFRGAHTKFND